MKSKLEKFLDVCIVILVLLIVTGVGFTGYDTLERLNKVSRKVETQESSLNFIAEQNFEVQDLIYDMKDDFEKDLEYVKEDLGSIEHNASLTRLNIDEIVEAFNGNINGTNKFRRKVAKAINVLNDVVKKPSYEYLKSVTVVMLNTSLFGSSLGTGVIVKNSREESLILTNSHVCSDYGLCMADVDGKKYLTEIVKRGVGEKMDMLLVRVNGWIDDRSQVKGLHEVEAQDKVYTIGHGLARPYLYGEGTVAGYDNIDLVVSLPVINGSSGSGVFDQNGYLVGLVYSIRLHQSDYGIIPDPGHGYCVDGKYIKEFLNGYAY